MTTEPQHATTGDTVRLELPHTDACTHLGIGGQVRDVVIRPDHAQVLDDDGSPGPRLTHRDAGIYPTTTQPDMFRYLPTGVTFLIGFSEGDPWPDVHFDLDSARVSLSAITRDLHTLAPGEGITIRRVR